MSGLLGISLIFWSWSVGSWPLGLILTALLESPRWMPWRFQLQEKMLGRIFKLYLFLVVVVFFLLLIMQLQEGIYTFAQWFPLLAAPVMVLQLYHEQESLPLQRLFSSSMHRPSNSVSPSPEKFDLRLFYVFITLIATSISAPDTIWTFLSFAAIVALSLWHARPGHFRLLKWGTLTSLALLLAFFIKGSLADLQVWVEAVTTDWLASDWSEADVFRSHTAMGQVGKLKLSSKILMRVRASDQRSLLLRQASYNTYLSGTWHMRQLIFQDLTKDPKTNTWPLSEHTPRARQQLSVSSNLKKGQGVLALPKGSYALHNERPGDLSRNSNGSVRIKNAPGPLDYVVYYSQTADENSKPSDADLRIPDSHRALIGKIVSEIGINKLSRQAAPKILGNYFEENFRYSLIQDDRDMLSKPLDYFLNGSRKGHCEYFATAGALILRAVGIPARYVTGYAMSEFDENMQTYLIRARHAHAWTLAYINDRWVELDFTPSTWAALEAERDPWWQGIHDFLSLKIEDVQRWWEDETDEALRAGIFSIVVFMLFYFRKRLRFSRLNLSWQRQFDNKRRSINSQVDSPFQSIINHLEQTIDPRKPQETIQSWLIRIQRQLGPHKSRLDPLLKQHYELLYGETPVSAQGLSQFTQQVQHWLAQTNNDEF